MSRCSESLVINTLNQSEGVPAEAESAGKENFWNGLCRKAKHTGFREIIAFNLFSLLSGRIPVLCKTPPLPCWNQLCHALPHCAWPGQHHYQLCQSLWCQWVFGEHYHWKHGTDEIIPLSLVFSWECVVWSVSLAVLLFPFSGSNLGHLTLHS